MKSIKTVVFKKEMTWPEAATYGLHGTYPMNLMWFLGMYREQGQVPNCSAINLIGSTREFIKWANQFKHYRIKKCKLTWVPMIKGPIRRVDPGRWGVYQPQNLAPDTMLEYISAAQPAGIIGADYVATQSYQTDYEAYIVNPTVMPAYGDLDGNIGVKQYFLSDRDFGDLAISNEMLPYIKRPHAKRHLMDNTWSHVWYPKVPKVFRFGHTGSNNDPNDGQHNLLYVTDGTLSKFPWLPLITVSRGNIAGQQPQPYDESIAMRADCTVPYIAIRNRRTYQWVGPNNGQSVRSILGIPGKWHFHVTFQFKTRRSSMAQQITDMDSNGTFTKSGVSKVTAPQNPVNGL